jgi:MFS family permease
MLVGGVLLFIGAVLLSRMNETVSYWEVTIYMVLCGVGIGPTMPLYPLAVQNSVEHAKIGQATSAAQFCRQIGGLVGAAALGAVLGTALISSFHTELAGLPGVEFDFKASSRGRPNVEAMLSGARASIRVEMDRRFVTAVMAVHGGDLVGATRTLDGAPDLVRADAARIFATPGEAQDARLPDLKKSFDAFGDDVTARMETGVKRAFTRAVTRVYTCVAFMVLVAWLVTWLLPELPLRKTLK